MINNINEILTEGMVIKNYKEACKLFGEIEKTGKSKQLQLDDWKRYFDFEKDGQKFVITYMFLNEKEKIDNRGKSVGSRRNHSVYIKFIETLLLHKLSKLDDDLVCTKNYLLLSLGMVDSNYTNKDYRDYLVDKNKFNNREIHEFDMRAYNILDRILFSALNSLQNRFLITWEQELHYIIDVDGQDEDITGTRIDKKNYMDAKFDIARELGEEEGNADKYDNLSDIFFYNKTVKFYTKLKDYLYKTYGWKSSCIKYRITFNKDNVNSSIERTENQLKKLMRKNKNELNTKIIEALNNNAISKYENNQKKIKDEIEELKIINNTSYIPYEVLTTFILPRNYIKRQEELAYEMININKGKKFSDKNCHLSNRAILNKN